MPRRRSIPGSIYADRGKLIIKFKGKVTFTGLDDTKNNRIRAERMLISMWEAYHQQGGVMPGPMLIYDAFEDFKIFKGNRFEKTLRQYQLAFDTIVTDNYWLSADSVEADIRSYVRHTGHSPVTVNTYLTNLQTFLNYCTRKKWLPATTFKQDYKVSEPKTQVQTWQPAEIEKLLSYLDAYPSPQGTHHNQLGNLIRFQLLTGARLVDCLTLLPEDIQGNIVTFKNKITKEPEPRPIRSEAVDLLNNLPQFTDRIFPWRHSTASRLNRWLSDACLKCGIKQNKRSFQEFRTTFRMTLLDSGIQPEYAQYLMRHKRFETTEQFYTRYAGSELLNQLEKVPIISDIGRKKS